MASTILLYRGKDIVIYSMKGIPKNEESPSLDTLAKIIVEVCEFKLGEKIPEFEEIIVCENPSRKYAKEIHSFYKQIIQTRISEGFYAVSLKD